MRRRGRIPPAIRPVRSAVRPSGVTLRDFGALPPAEQKLRDGVGSGEVVVVSPFVPDADTPEVRVRASFIRYLALGGCPACRPHHRGGAAAGRLRSRRRARGGPDAWHRPGGLHAGRRPPLVCLSYPGRTALIGEAQTRWLTSPRMTQLSCYLRQPEAASYPRFQAAVYSLDALLPIVDFEMQRHWTPDEDRGLREAMTRYYLWVHIFAGWALSLLAVAGFSGLVKSE